MDFFTKKMDYIWYVSWVRVKKGVAEATNGNRMMKHCF